MTTTVVVPCYNEASRLDPHGFVELVDGVDRVLFVDDGSTDKTLDVLRDLARDLGPSADVLVLDANVGKAEAVRVGLNAALDAGSELVGYLDADLATPAAEMVRLLAVADAQPSRAAVIGSRVALLGHTVRRRPTRHYLGRLYATAASLALGVPVYDTQCGAKVFRAGGPLRDALSAPFHDRWSFDVELLGRLLAHPEQNDDSILEVPLNRWNDVAGSRLTAVDGVRAAIALSGVRGRVRRHVATTA